MLNRPNESKSRTSNELQVMHDEHLPPINNGHDSTSHFSANEASIDLSSKRGSLGYSQFNNPLTNKIALYLRQKALRMSNNLRNQTAVESIKEEVDHPH